MAKRTVTLRHASLMATPRVTRDRAEGPYAVVGCKRVRLQAIVALR